jgi:CO/xanthine dehydrogenase Mo-binding subunit
MPMIEPILVEVPNPAHRYGAKGVGEVNIVPPMGAIANAIDGGIHQTAYSQPIRPGCEIFFIPKLEWG